MKKLRFKLSSFDCQLIDKSIGIIVKTALDTGSKVNGPIPLKTGSTKKYVRILEVYDTQPKTVDALIKLNIPASIHVDIKQLD